MGPTHTRRRVFSLISLGGKFTLGSSSKVEQLKTPGDASTIPLKLMYVNQSEVTNHILSGQGN